ncbi:hypothetical protein [Paraferrimonas haliotis]|uniref:Uncharacterized protein n=1 Tax=Paraferrimonas haliotis TaxID=2013866 RepID=A0AA37TNM1_9GAMM|nr:hypothetical protein [Paraferrimonas haliotis]GLS82785.1 hypothetical protein GCM10007894_07620 [Paraferrimonas haliotis]
MLSGCSAVSEHNNCGIIAAYQTPEMSNNHYRVLVTAINGKPVMSRPMYQLPPGKVSLQLVELIDSDALTLQAKDRQFINFELDIQANIRYHLVAQFPPTEAAQSYWEPVVVEREVFHCSQEQPFVRQQPTP